MIPAWGIFSGVQKGKNLTPGVPLESPIPDLFLCTDALDHGWGATLDDNCLSGVWSSEERRESINFQELKAILLSICQLRPLLQDKVIAIFCDNTTAISYLKKSGGMKSHSLNALAQVVLKECESLEIILMPQFVAGSLNALAYSLSRSNQVLGAEWTLCQDVFNQLLHKWPAIIDLFATDLSTRLPVYFSPVRDPAVAGVDAMLQSWDCFQAYAFPPFGMIQQVLLKLCQSKGVTLTLIAPFWPQKAWFPDLLDHLVEVPVSLPLRRDLLR